MPISNWLLLIVAVVSIFLGTKMLYLDTSNKINRVTFVCFALTAFYAIVEFSLQLIQDIELAKVMGWYHGCIISLILIFYLFSTKFYSEIEKPFPKWYNNIIIPGIVISFLSQFVLQTNYNTAFSPAPILDDGVWKYVFHTDRLSYYLFCFNCVFGIMLSIYHFYHGYRHATNKGDKKVRRILLIIYLIIPMGLVFYFILTVSDQQMGEFKVSPFTFFCLYIVSLFYSNYQMWEFDPYKSFDEIFNSISNEVVIMDENQRVKYLNESAKRKYDEKELKSDFTKKYFISKENLEVINEKGEFEKEFTSENGNSFLINFSSIFNKKGRSGYAAISSDISKIKDYEQQLQNLNNELIEKNVELERFAYIASHDLKTPIRNIVSFLSLINRELKQYDNESLEEYIDFAKKNAKQMYNLVEDVLEFSRLTSKKQNVFELQDIRQIINTAIANIDILIKEKKAKIIIPDHIPKIKSDAAKLILIFQNLIENGLKYNESILPTITISFEENDEFYKFSIEDNGIGIRDEFHDDIFKMFKRLHTQEKFEGTGIGLAVCQKVTTHHKGKVWIESKPTSGSIFYFTISKSL